MLFASKLFKQRVQVITIQLWLQKQPTGRISQNPRLLTNRLPLLHEPEVLLMEFLPPVKYTFVSVCGSGSVYACVFRAEFIKCRPTEINWYRGILNTERPLPHLW